MDDENDRDTFDSIVTISPNLIALLNDTLLTAAVTTTRRQCRCADMAAVMSIQLSNWPPIRLPRVLVSLGRIIFALDANVSLANFVSFI